MKKLLSIFFAIIGIIRVNAQEEGKFRVGLDFGGVFSQEEVGILLSIEPKYNLTDKKLFFHKLVSIKDMINKLVPGLLESENKRINDFYANRGLSVPQNGNSSRPITPNSPGNSLNAFVYCNNENKLKKKSVSVPLLFHHVHCITVMFHLRCRNGKVSSRRW